MATPLTATCGTWLESADCDGDDFHALVPTVTEPGDRPLASEVRDGVPGYPAHTLAFFNPALFHGVGRAMETLDTTRRIP